MKTFNLKELLTNITNRLIDIGTASAHTADPVSCATGKYYQIAYLTLAPGKWFIDANGYFPGTNATGIRRVSVTTATSNYNNVTTAPAAVGNIAIDAHAGANMAQFPQVHFPITPTETTTYRLIAYQTSGSTISVTGRMYATRIK